MSDSQLTKGLKNIKYSFIAQSVILIIGVLKTLIVPSVLTVDSYAYWQMYLFYISYIGFFYLGFNDGILLKYGKYNYADLPFEKMRRSMHFYLIMLALFTGVAMLYALSISDPQKMFVTVMVAASIIMYGLNGVFIYIFLITNQIRRHSFFSAVDSVSNFIGILLLLLLKQNDFHLLVYFVFITKLISVIAMTILCRKTLFGKACPVKEGFLEFLDNIKAGIFLMLAQIMSMLVTGLGRIFIEYSGELKNYAYYSFGMTVLNIVMVGVTAIATVMYPTLGRVQKELLPKVFNKIFDYFSHFNVFVVLLYFPAYILVGILFPKYSPMLTYFSIMFVTMTWQSKVNITTNCYFRVLRMERKMLKINALSVVCFCIVYFILRFTVGNFVSSPITIVALSTCLSMVFLELMAELTLRKALQLKMGTHSIKDAVINVIFLAVSLISNKYLGFAVYFVVAATYAVIKRKALKSDIQKVLKVFFKNKKENA